MEFSTPVEKRHEKVKKVSIKKRKAERLRKVKKLKNKKKSETIVIKKNQKFLFLPLELSNKTKWKLRFFPMSSVKAIQELEKIQSGKTFTFQETTETKKELEDAVKKILDVRWKLRRLVLLWRYNKCRAANDVDPFTLDSIEEPIRIYNIPLKVYYQFEAKSLGVYWRMSLKESDGLIPTPKWPRNPLTNLPIYKNTLYCISEKLINKGYTDSFFISLAETKFNLTLWKSIYQIPLRLNAVKNTFLNTNSRDCIDYTYDYIELQCQIHNIQYSKPFYDWIFFKRKHNTIEEKAKVVKNLWIRYCKDFHEKDILNPERSEFSKELAKVHPIVKNLLNTTLSLYRFFQEYLIDRNVNYPQ